MRFDQAGPECTSKRDARSQGATGIEFGFDLDNARGRHIRSRLVLELASGQHPSFQGQITEGERAIADGANADPERTTPETFQKLVGYHVRP